MALNSIRPSNVNHRPPSCGRDCTLFDTTTWVCRSGSPVRESRWSNAAAIRPVTGTCRIPPLPTRVNATSFSSIARVVRTASWCAASTCPATSGEARAHNVETDFTGENVRSYPATGTCAGRDAEARNFVRSPSSAGARPCRSSNAARATWVRIRARSSTAMGWFHTNPRLVLCSLNARAVTCRKVVASKVGNARPKPPHPRAAASGSVERG